MFGNNELQLSTYLDFEDYQRTNNHLLLVVFVNRNEPLSPQINALQYLRKRHPALPVFILPSSYCDTKRVKYNIASFPTYLFLRENHEAARFVGRVTGRIIEDFLLGPEPDGLMQGGNRVSANWRLPLQ